MCVCVCVCVQTLFTAQEVHVYVFSSTMSCSYTMTRCCHIRYTVVYLVTLLLFRQILLLLVFCISASGYALLKCVVDF